MILWMMAGYVLTAVAFYSYVIKTAQEEPQEQAAGPFPGKVILEVQGDRLHAARSGRHVEGLRSLAQFRPGRVREQPLEGWVACLGFVAADRHLRDAVRAALRRY